MIWINRRSFGRIVGVVAVVVLLTACARSESPSADEVPFRYVEGSGPCLESIGTVVLAET